VTDQFIGGHAQCRVGTDAAVGIGSTALFGEDQFTEGLGGALTVLGGRKQTKDGGGSGFDGLAGATGGLDVEEDGGMGMGEIRIEVMLSTDLVELVDLATEPNHHAAGDVGVSRNPGQDAHEDLVGCPGLKAAAPFVGKGDDAVDIGEVASEQTVGKPVLNVTRDGGGAIHAGDDGEVIAGADPGVGAGVTGKRPDDVWQWLVRCRADHEPGVTREIANHKIVGMDVIARTDDLRGEADDLAVLLDCGAGGEAPQGNFMSGRDQPGKSERAERRVQFQSGGQRGAGDCDVVAGSEDEGQVIEPGSFHRERGGR